MGRNGWWQAALRRDPAYDGAFVFGVTTTAIYCRASCPARRPRPDHVVFFRTPKEAEREGFRACRRCGTRGKGGILDACDFIACHIDESLTLTRLASHVGWSPFHLQRVFRRSLGVTPGQYARRLRFERFRRRLGIGDGVARALHAAGFGSSSRLYERSAAQLGMTPMVLAKWGAGMSIAYDIVTCPLGRALIAATPIGICAVELGASDRALAAELRRRFRGASIRRNPGLLRFARAPFGRLFSGEIRDARLPLDVRATAFQARVWESLRAIPFGETRTYAEVARAIGRPSAARAVARACASNPAALIIPCHRVVGGDGLPRGYRWGIARKTAMLKRECAILRLNR